MNDCKHTNTETRSMSHCNQIKLQCLDCGQSVGNAIRHASITPEVLATIQEFDYEFRDLMIERRSEVFKSEVREERAKRDEQLEQKRAEYAEYLKSKEWKALRSKVIDRENGLCQGCRERPIQEVHHLTYVNCRDELLFQLVGLCSGCHIKAHSKNEP